MSRSTFLTPDFKGNRLLSVATPVGGTDGVNKDYVDIQPRWTGKSATTTVPNASGVGFSTWAGVTARDISHSVVTAKHTIAKSGLYVISAYALWSAAKSAGKRQWLEFEITGKTTSYRDGCEDSESTQVLTIMYPFTAGLDFTTVAYQTSGASMTVTVELHVMKVAEL